MDFRNNTKCVGSTEDFFTGQWFGSATQLSIYSDAAESAGLSFKLLESSPDHFVGELRATSGQLITVYFGKNPTARRPATISKRKGVNDPFSPKTKIRSITTSQIIAQ